MAIILRELLDRLPPSDKEALNYAFEHDLQYYVVIEDHKFIGVNIEHIKHLHPEFRVGAWSVGHVAN